MVSAAAPEPARAAETAQAIVKEAEPTIVSYEEADGVSPMLQVASAYASASAVKGSRLEPTAVALTKTNGAAPQPLVTLAEYRAAPASVASLYMAVLNGLPDGSRVSKGLQVGKGEWVLALDDLAGVEIAVPTSVKRLVVARVEISGQDGVSIASFPLVVDPEGRIDTETVASVAVMKDTGLAQRPTKVAARIEQQAAPQPVRAKPQAKSQQNSQKDAVAPAAPQQKRKTAVVRPAAPIIKPTTTANIPLDTAEAIAASSCWDHAGGIGWARHLPHLLAARRPGAAVELRRFDSGIKKPPESLRRLRISMRLGLGQLHLAGLLAAALAVVLEDERDLVALVDAVDACALERRDVKENVLRAVFRLNEAKALSGVEEFHSAS